MSMSPVSVPRDFFVRLREAAADPLRVTTAGFARHGDIFQVGEGAQTVWHLRHPDHIRSVLVNQASSFRRTTANSSHFPGGLLAAEGAEWRRQRMPLSAALRPARLMAHAGLVSRIADGVVDTWGDGQGIDVYREMRVLSLRLTCERILGVEVRDGDVERVGAALDVAQAQTRVPEKLARARGVIVEVARSIIARRAARDFGSEDDALSVALSRSDGAADNLCDQVATLLLTGFGTTARALTWMWHLLGDAPDARTRMWTELDAAGASGPAAQDGRLPYVRQVVAESLRLHPPIPALGRVALRPVEIGGRAVGEGALIMCWVFHAHRDDRWFEAPATFRPERFTPPMDRRMQHAYMPFGAGPRTCVAGGFAQMAIETVLATMARRVHLEPERSRGVQPGCARTSLTSTEGLPMVVHFRS